MNDKIIAVLNMAALFSFLLLVWYLVRVWSRQSIEEIKDRYPQAYKRHYKKD